MYGQRMYERARLNLTTFNGNYNILIPVQVEWRVELNPSPLLWYTPTLISKLKSVVSFSHDNYVIAFSTSFFSLFLFSAFPSPPSLVPI